MPTATRSVLPLLVAGAMGFLAILFLAPPFMARFSVWPEILAWPWEARFAAALLLAVGSAEWLTRREDLYFLEGWGIALLALVSTLSAIWVGGANGFMEPMPSEDDLGMIWIPALIGYQIWRAKKGWGRKVLELE